jgi:hypothetical protein
VCVCVCVCVQFKIWSIPNFIFSHFFLYSYIHWLSYNADSGPTLSVLQYMEVKAVPLQRLYDLLTHMERHDAARDVHDVIRKRTTSGRGLNQPVESPFDESMEYTENMGLRRNVGDDNFMTSRAMTSDNSMASHFCEVMHGHALASLPSLLSHETLMKTRFSEETMPANTRQKKEDCASTSRVVSDVRQSHVSDVRSTSFPSFSLRNQTLSRQIGALKSSPGSRGEEQEHYFPMSDDEN